jgi:hypothetical protein
VRRGAKFECGVKAQPGTDGGRLRGGSGGGGGCYAAVWLGGALEEERGVLGGSVECPGVHKNQPAGRRNLLGPAVGCDAVTLVRWYAGSGSRSLAASGPVTGPLVQRIAWSRRHQGFFSTLIAHVRRILHPCMQLSRAPAGACRAQSTRDRAAGKSKCLHHRLIVRHQVRLLPIWQARWTKLQTLQWHVFGNWPMYTPRRPCLPLIAI